jgi:hypothetical protein
MAATERSSARRTWALAVLAVVAFVAGGTIGGYLDYEAWHVNAAVTSAIPVTAAFLVAVGAGIWWLRTRRSAAAFTAIAAGAFFLGTQVGAWVAPTAQRPEWSPGSVQLELTRPAVGAVSGQAACFTSDDGSFTVQLDPPQALAGSAVQFYIRGAGPDRNRGSISFFMDVEPISSGPIWTTEFETMPPVDILDVVRITGTAASGSADLVAIPLSPESPAGHAFGGPAADSIDATMTWTCEPPRGVTTPIEGTWFQ